MLGLIVRRRGRSRRRRYRRHGWCSERIGGLFWRRRRRRNNIGGGRVLCGRCRMLGGLRLTNGYLRRMCDVGWTWGSRRRLRGIKDRIDFSGERLPSRRNRETELSCSRGDCAKEWEEFHPLHVISSVFREVVDATTRRVRDDLHFFGGKTPAFILLSRQSTSARRRGVRCFISKNEWSLDIASTALRLVPRTSASPSFPARQIESAGEKSG